MKKHMSQDEIKIEALKGLIAQHECEIKELKEEVGELRGAVSDAFDKLDRSPELNMCNYTADEVENLNNDVIGAYNIIAKAKGSKMSKLGYNDYNDARLTPDEPPTCPEACGGELSLDGGIAICSGCGREWRYDEDGLGDEIKQDDHLITDFI